MKHRNAEPTAANPTVGAKSVVGMAVAVPAASVRHGNSVKTVNVTVVRRSIAPSL